jgi:hypothetical protein
MFCTPSRMYDEDFTLRGTVLHLKRRKKPIIMQQKVEYVQTADRMHELMI